MTETRSFRPFDVDILGPPGKAEPKFGLKSFRCPACGAEFATSVAASTRMADDCADEILAALDMD
jgi:hypothetical protein